MNSLLILILHLILYGLPPFLVVKFFHTFKSVSFFYAYFGFLFVFTQLFAVFYSIRLSDYLIITGGNIAYSSIILITFFIAIVSQDPTVVRNLISIQVILNLFLFFLYVLLYAVLNEPETINIFSISPEIFSTTITINIVSSCVFIIEILGMFFILVKIKELTNNFMLIILLCIALYVGILVLDGFLFPFIISFFEPEFGQFIVGGIYGKLILGIGFAPFLLAFMTIHRNSLESYLKDPFSIKEILIPPRRALLKRLKKTELELKESEERYRNAYEQANLYRDLFVHDMRNILQNVNSSYELLSEFIYDPAKEEKSKKLLEMTGEQVRRGKELISNIQKLSQLEEVNIILEKINPYEFLEKSIAFIKNSFSKKKINIEVDIQNEKSLVQANELLLDVFENILTNAIRYNQSPIVEITIKCSKEQKKGVKYLKFEFMDNGRGISADQKKLIFQKGQRREKRSQGMGLGLSVVNKIMESYKGHIWVEDRIKGDYMKGSNFILLIPEVMP